jgi:hypothetical protein
MAGLGRRTFAPGEVLTASNVMNYLQDQAVMNFAGTAARGSAIGTAVSEGMVSYLSDSDLVEIYNGSAWKQFGKTTGSILQIVRATDTTLRSTTSTSFVDVTGVSVTITPSSTTSQIIVMATGQLTSVWSVGNDGYSYIQLTDSGNTALSGAQSQVNGSEDQSGTGTRDNFNSFNIVGFSTPNTTSPVTYKLRMRSVTANVTTNISNNTNTGQIFAIEVSA